jgi:hypothetical protein
MAHVFGRFALTFGLALFATGPAFTQIASTEPVADASTATAAVAAVPAAYIYIQTPQGIDVYTVTPAGKPSLLAGSPFPVVGGFRGINGAYLITIGTYWLRSYAIETSGAVGKEAARIDTQSYGGSQCGPANGEGILDHTGKFFYVSLYLGEEEGDGGCAVWQSYEIESNGQFKYLGYVESYGAPQGYVYPDSVPTVSSNDKFAYATSPQFEDGNYSSFAPFKIASNGGLEGLPGFEHQDPQTPNGDWFYYPSAVAADNAGHLAAVLNWFVYGGPPRLASYAIDSAGNLTTTNTSTDMPALENGGPIVMSPSGKVLVVRDGSGLELYHFNGAAPITPYKTLLPAVSFGTPVWDYNNHMYAFGNGLLYVFTVTPTSITQVSGSPFKLKDGGGTMFITAHAW